ncbi:MAG: DUF308 domain-containing protein [Erysipelotrichaceae bacterium]|nr:DUF308 domain-containing protein [Erysipelotrichaceae bacterium]
MLHYNDDIIDDMNDRLNKRLNTMRTVGIVISIAMIICGILCLMFPTKTLSAIVIIGAIMLIVSGVYQIIDYVSLPSMLRFAGNMSCGIINVIIGLILLISPKQLTIHVLVYIFGFILLFYGINKLTFAHQLSYFNMYGYSWPVMTSIIMIIVALIFLISPMFVSIILSYILAIYLIVEGITQLVEVINMHDLVI